MASSCKKGERLRVIGEQPAEFNRVSFVATPAPPARMLVTDGLQTALPPLPLITNRLAIAAKHPNILKYRSNLPSDFPCEIFPLLSATRLHENRGKG